MRTIVTDQSWKGPAWVSTATIAALVVGVVLGTSLATRTDALAQPSVTFSGESAVLMNFVAPAQTADFERVMRAYSAGLSGSDNAESNQMGAGLKVFRAAEPGLNNTVLYLWIVDHVVPGANYAVTPVLNDEVQPGPPGNGVEVQELYEAYIGSLEGGGQQQVNMTLVMEF
jgi:hypothetical protein